MKSNHFLPLLLIVFFAVTVFLIPGIPVSAVEQPEYGKIVYPFKLNDIRLTSGTRLYNMMILNKNYILSLNNDSILYSFRQTAGLSAPGTPFGGWEDPGVQLRGHFSGGHLLSALAKMYAGTGDINCKNKADYLISELAKCQNALGTGYLSAYPSSVLDTLEANVTWTWAPYYTLHKILAGLMDCYKYCGNTTALNMETWMAAYIKGRMDRLTSGQIDAFLETRPFVWNFYHEHGGIGEALSDLYQVTGDANTLSLANIFDRSYFTNPLVNNADELGCQEYHANSHIPMVAALARHYEVTNDTSYKNATVNFLNTMTSGHTFPTGGTSGTSPSHVQGMTSEYWSYPNLLYEHSLGQTGESCCSHNLNEITAKIFTWTADAKYADEYEKRLVNAVMSQQNPNDGMLLYNLSIGQGATKSFGGATNTFWCCTGSGVEAFATLADGAYFNDNGNGLFINQFVDSTLTWSAQGLTLKQTTNFPEEQGTKLQFNLSAPKNLSVKIRIPSWATQGVVVKINSVVQSVTATPNTYIILNRTWNNGDLVEMTLPFSLRAVRMPDRPDYIAIMYGPELLVACTTSGATYNGNESQFLSSLTPVGGQPCTFTTNLSTGNVTFKPLNRIVGETYNGYTIITLPISSTVKDSVSIANQTSETAHNLQSLNSNTGSFNGKNWRDAVNGWFSYNMAVDSGKSMYIRCTYWGSDATNRVFYIQIDGNNIATQRLENNKPNNFFQLLYPIPTALTSGKSNVTVRFQAKSGMQAGGVFDLVEMITYDGGSSTPGPTSTPTPSPTPRSAFNQIEAETYDSKSGSVQAETCGEGGQNLGFIATGDYVVYNSVNFGSGATGFQGRIAGLSTSGKIDIRLDSQTGTLVGTLNGVNTGDWQTYTTASCSVSGASGVHNLYLVFTAGLNLNWFKFTSGSATQTPTPTPTPTQTGQPPVVWYKFDESSGTTAYDSSGNGKNATLVNGPTWVNGKSGKAVNLDGTNDYVSMPTGIVGSLNDFTIATWVKLDTISTWSRIFDFGTGTTVNMFLTPRGGSNVIRYAITTGGGTAEQQINGTAALATGSWQHVAVTLSGSLGILYVNGAEVGRNSSMTLKPSSLGSTNLNYIGKSQYADPYLDGQVDSFRIYNRALSAAEVNSLFTAGN